MRIETIYIKGFKNSEKELNIKFSSEPISVIFGANGAGKTTLLKIIHAFLNQDNVWLLENNIEFIQVTYTNGYDQQVKTVTVERNEKWNKRFKNIEKRIISSKIGNEYKDNAVLTLNNDSLTSVELYTWSGYEESEFNDSTSILFGTNRGISSSNLNITASTIMDFIDVHPYHSRVFKTRSSVREFATDFSDFLRRYTRRKGLLRKSNNAIDLQTAHLNLDSIAMEAIESILIERYSLAKKITNERVQKALFDTLSVVISEERTEHEKILPNNFSEIISENKERLIEALNSSPENSLRDQLVAILKQDRNFSDVKNNLLTNLLLKMTHELQSEKTILNSIDTLENVFNDHLLSDKKLIVTQDEVYIEIGDYRHSLNELSSGEKHLLSLLTLFIIEGSKRDFLIIDEPEISLNLKWQRKLLTLLNSLTPNSQIIVASHSPSMAIKNTGFLVEI